MSRLRPKTNAAPITKVVLVSGLDVRMICNPAITMKQVRNTTIAPWTGAGMIDNSAPSLGEKPSRMNNPPGGVSDVAAGRARGARERDVARRGIRRDASEHTRQGHAQPVRHQTVADALDVG